MHGVVSSALFLHPGLLVVLVLVGFLAGCSSGPKPQTAFHAIESKQQLDTDGRSSSQFHAAVYNPSAVSLDFPGFVVGVDKSPAKKIAAPGDIITRPIESYGTGIARDIKRIGGDHKLLFISQVYEYTGRPYGEGDCTLFNTYLAHVDAPLTERYSRLMDWCDGRAPETNSRPTYATLSAYRESWDAIDALNARLDQLVGKGSDYTHLVVMVMGWNTSQIEAYQNFNSLMGNLRKAAGDAPFRPLFIGVTWPSLWSNPWLDPLWKGWSYPTKADDADELGLSWLGVLLRDVVARAKSRQGKELRTVLIGHSFGARAGSMANCVGPAVQRVASDDRADPPAIGVDVMINLEPAYSINRFLTPKAGFFDERIDYPPQCADRTRIALTASSGDKAVKVQLIADMAADIAQYQRHCGTQPDPEFRCAKAEPDGLLYSDTTGDGPVLYIDASELVRYATPGSANTSGAHNDIYRPDTGRLLWTLIQGKNGI